MHVRNDDHQFVRSGHEDIVSREGKSELLIVWVRGGEIAVFETHMTCMKTRQFARGLKYSGMHLQMPLTENDNDLHRYFWKLNVYK